MKSDLSTLITNLIKQTDPELELRLESQAEALNDSKCTNPVVGQWVDQNNLDYLKSIFDLDNYNFAKRFPTMGHVSHKRRQQMMAAIEEHVDYCQHCCLKRGYDMQLDSRLERAFRESDNLLMQLLDEDDDITEGEHLNFEPSMHHGHKDSYVDRPDDLGGFPELVTEPAT